MKQTLKNLLFVACFFSFGTHARSESFAETDTSSAKSFQEWCSDESISKEKRRTVSALLVIAGTSNCFDANYRLLSFTSLNLRSEGLVDLEPIGSLPQLESLSLDGNLFESLDTLPFLPSLRTLSLVSSKIKSLSGIAKFVQLRSLDISNTRVASLLGVERLRRLQRIQLNRTEVVSLEPLREHKEITYFEMANCANNVAPQDLSALATNKLAFQLLAITNCGVKDASDLRGIPQIATLNLSGNELTDLDFLDQTSELYQIQANGNKIRSVEALGRFERTLNEVHLRKNRIGDVRPLSVLKRVQYQFSLSLQENPIRKEKCPTDSLNIPLNQYCQTLQNLP